MTVTLRDALLVMEERKKAMGITMPVTPGDQVDLSPLLIGTDLDRDELEEIITRLVMSAVTMLGPILGPPVSGFIGGAWFDGLVVGLQLAEMRQREDALSEEEQGG